MKHLSEKCTKSWLNCSLVASRAQTTNGLADNDPKWMVSADDCVIKEDSYYRNTNF